MHTYMPKNEILPKIYQTRETLTHTCLKSGPYMPQVIHTCILHMSVLWIHKICILETQALGSALWKSKICILETQDLRSVVWKHKICILEAQDQHSGNTRSGICILETQDL